MYLITAGNKQQEATLMTKIPIERDQISQIDILSNSEIKLLILSDLVQNTFFAVLFLTLANELN